MKFYLVGGAVRDQLMGRESRDRDYVVVGATQEQMLNMGYKKVGADFPVFLHPESGEEYALARNERKTGPGYNGFEVDFSPNVTLEEDLYRRDLTINSMAIENMTGRVIDPYGGVNDLNNKILRHTSEAFAEDPVRVLRIARFAARYTDFRIHESTLGLMREIVTEEFEYLTAERVWMEFKKGLMEQTPSIMFSYLYQVGADEYLREWFNWGAGQHHFCGRDMALDQAALNEQPLEIRFAIIATGFKKKEDYRKWCVSSDCEEVATIVNNELNTVKLYPTLQPREKIQLFNRVDLWRRPARFNSAVTACTYLMHDFNFSRHGMAVDIGELDQIDEAAIARNTQDVRKIKDAIFEARVKALS